MMIRTGGLGRNLAGLGLALAWILGAGGCSEPAETPALHPAATTSAASAPDAQPTASAAAPAPQGQAVARTKYGMITTQDLTYYTRTGLCAPMQAVLHTSSSSMLRTKAQLKPVLDWIASRQAAAAEVAAKNDPKLNAYVEDGLLNLKDRIMFRLTYQTEIKDRVSSPTQEELQAYYEKNKSFYLQPFSYTIRPLLLLTYEPYVVQAGDVGDTPDKLDAIAEKVNGDPKTGSQIRADVPGRALRHDPEKLLFKPLYTGEKLLVPMSKQRMEEVRSRLEAILKQIKPTTSTQELDRQFGELARMNDESGLQGNITTPLPTGTKQDKPPLAEITRVVKATKVGRISKIFQTKHGFEVVEVMDRVDSQTLPLSNPLVFQEVMSNLSEEKINRANEDLIGTLMDNPSLKIDYRQIANGNQLTTDTVVAALGSAKLLWRDLRGAWVEEGRPTDEGRIRKFLSHNPLIATILFRDHFRAQMEDPKTEMGRQMQILKTAFVGSAYITKLAYDQVAVNLSKSKEPAKAYYEAHREEFQAPELLTYVALLWPMSRADILLHGAAQEQAQAALLKTAQADMANVKTKTDFLNLKAKLDEQLMLKQVTPPDTTKPLPFKELSAQYQAILKDVGPDHWTPPALIKDQNYVVSFMVKERTQARQQSFEESLDKVNQLLFGKFTADAMKRVEDEMAQRAGLEFLLKGDTLVLDKHLASQATPAAGKKQ